MVRLLALTGNTDFESRQEKDIFRLPFPVVHPALLLVILNSTLVEIFLLMKVSSSSDDLSVCYEVVMPSLRGCNEAFICVIYTFVLAQSSHSS